MIENTSKNSKNFHVSTPKTTSAESKITKAARAWKALDLTDHFDSHGAKHSPSDPPRGPNDAKPGGPPGCMAWTPLDCFLSSQNEPFSKKQLFDPNDF